MRCLNDVIDSLLDRNNIDERINSIYDDLLKILHDEMDTTLKYKDIVPNVSKRKRFISKPY